MSIPDDVDDPPTTSGADRYPSAKAMTELGESLKLPDPADRRRRTWQVITGASANPDFHAVLDFARDHELVADCERSDPREPNPRWVNPIDGSEMVWIPGGPFLYGPSKQQVECGGFSLGRFPVTNEQFVRFVREVGYAPPAGHPDGHLFLSHWRRGAVPRGLEKHPVVWVSLFDALAYCRWAGGTLPTEWMWEKAARGPEGRSHPWGEGGPVAGKTKLAQVAARGTCPVGTFSKVRSPYGCEDLIGNVSEWCYPLPEGAPVGRFPPPWPDPPMVGRRGEPVYGVVRGACFLRGGTTTARSTYRRRLSVTRRNYWTGFRVASLLPCQPVG